MLGNILIILFFLMIPSVVLKLCRKVGWLDKIGPVLILYIIGIIVGNVFKPSGMAQIQDIFSSATIPLAIPLMLFSCKFNRSQTRSQFLALVTGIVAVLSAVVVGFLLFGKDIPQGPQIGGMLTGVYTGGSINLAALKVMLDVSDETFILLNSYDMVICFLYLAFLLSIGIKLFRKLLNPKSDSAKDEMIEGENTITEERSNPYEGLFTKKGLRDIGFLLAVDAVIIGISAGLGLLAGDGAFMTVLILCLTTLGITASFWRPVKSKKYGYETGMYLIYIFSVVVASMADLSKIEAGSSINTLCYLVFVIFGSLFIQFILARLFRIDADTMTVSSVAFICSPPFIPMMAAAMKNRNVLVSGLTIGVIGYAAGNYLGFLISKLLALLL